MLINLQFPLQPEFRGMPVGYRSDWTHPLLLYYVVEWADKTYAVKVSMLMRTLNEKLKLENRTLQEEIESNERLVAKNLFF